MIELKPCPFCSATPKLYNPLNTHDGFSVECPTVGCDTDKMRYTKAELIEARNRRAQPAQAVPLLSDAEIRDCLLACPQDTNEVLHGRWLYLKDFARAIEQAVLAKRGPQSDSVYTINSDHTRDQSNDQKNP